MQDSAIHKSQPDKKFVRYENGNLYFSRATERKFFFAMTVIMMIAGLLFKWGLLS
jgi:hypothetical protein